VLLVLLPLEFTPFPLHFTEYTILLFTTVFTMPPMPIPYDDNRLLIYKDANELWRLSSEDFTSWCREDLNWNRLAQETHEAVIFAERRQLWANTRDENGRDRDDPDIEHAVANDPVVVSEDCITKAQLSSGRPGYLAAVAISCCRCNRLWWSSC
jgi:hypothetical protein